MESLETSNPERPGWSTFAIPIAEATAAMLVQLFGAIVIAAGTAGLIAAVAAHRDAAHPGLVAGVAVLAVLMGAGVVALGRYGSGFLHRHLEATFHLFWSLSVLAVMFGQIGIGPKSVAVVMLYPLVPIFVVFLLRPVYAAAIVAVVAAQFAFVMCSQPGYAFPGVQILFFTIVLAATSVAVGGLLRHGVREASRVAGFRRFLPQAVAEAFLSTNAEPLLAPHRRKVGVCFCDLRGFTRFASRAEPEEVLEALDSYFDAVGSVLREHGATVGAFAGDGIFAYIGDPVPVPDPAEQIIRMAVALREPLEELRTRWRQSGFELGYGLGVAFGYATLGVIGFEGRSDYTALGPVVNLASRLCDQAEDRHILIDDRCFQVANDDIVATAVTLRLPGLEEPTAAHDIGPSDYRDNVRALRPETG